MSTSSGVSRAARPSRSTNATRTAAAGSNSGGLLSFSSRYSLRDKSSGTSSSRVSGAATAAAREEAKRRLQEVKNDVESAVHVLDGGIDRTPLPLQHRHSLVGGLAHDSQTGGSGGGSGSMRLDTSQDSSATTALMNAELGTSFLHSSFMLNSSMRSSTRKQSAISVERDGSVFAGGGGGGPRSRRGGDSSSKSLESSMQSLSFANDRHLAEQSVSVLDSTCRSSNANGGGGSSSSGVQRGSNGSNAIPRLVQQNTLLSEAAYVPPAPLSEEKKMAWRKAITTVTLAETPTIFLYSHHDEAVSKRCVEEAAAVKARNKAYAAIEEAYRVDEGTRFHTTGVATMRAPMKSIQTEVHPPATKDSGGLQVTPWMLKDAYEAALEGMNDGEEDENDDPQQQQQQQKDGAAGGDVNDALHEDGVGDDNIANDLDGEEEPNSDAAQSTMLSSDEATTTATEEPAGGGGGDVNAGVESSRQWMLADTLLSTLRIMERAVVQNYMEAAQLAYRGIAMDPASQRLTANNKKAANAAVAAAAAGSPPPLPPSPAIADSPLPATSVDDGPNSTKTARVTTAPPPPQQQLQQPQPQPQPLPSPNGREGKVDTAGTISSAGGVVESKAATTPAGMRNTATNAVPVRMSDDVRLLWRFGSSQLTRHRGVACMTWNTREFDMLAVGYTACRTGATTITAAVAATQAKDANGGVSGGGGASPQPAAQADLVGSDVNDCGMVLKRSLGQEAYGMICCWSLKNPLAPELVLFLRHEADVTALAFSNEQPSLLAVGSSTGEIVVYDIQRDVVFPSIAPATGTTAGQHTGAIWELQWVPKGKEQGEFLTSISADGRVVQWAVGKSIERVAPDLMHLQRQPGTQVEQVFVDGVAEAEAAAAAAAAESAAASGKGSRKLRPPPPEKRSTVAGGGTHSGTVGGKRNRGDNAHNGGGGGDDAVLSRQCGGMCFNVCPVDTAVYVVGTEDGSVLQCSKSQTENYDFEYEPHAELVYRVRWSPYSAAYFLTCSADWTARLYKVGTKKAQLRFNSARQDAVQDVAWSPTNALIFATATAQGTAEVWTVMDAMCPRASIEFEDHRHLSAVLFAEQETPVLVVGDEEGDVTVFCLKGECYLRQDLTDDEQEAWMTEVVRKQLT